MKSQRAPNAIMNPVMELQLLEQIARVDPAAVSSVYGPVRSWRVGMSLGIDPLLVNSICSFNCTYCQLGFIQVRIHERHRFVPTEKLMEDLRHSDWQKADIITFSGNGEPTLAENLGEAIREVKRFTGKPVLVLTNGTLLDRSDVQEELSAADKVFVKLDAGKETTFHRINRPVQGITLQGIVDGLLEFSRKYRGHLGIQMMITHVNVHQVDEFSVLLNRIRPHEVQLNTPTRPYPVEWVVQTRGSHDGVDYPARPLKMISRQQAEAFEKRLRELTGLPVVSVYGGA